MFTSRSFVRKFGRDNPFDDKKIPLAPWRVLFWIIFGAGVGLILTVAITWLATFWKVSSVSVEGSTFHDTEYILDTADIQEGSLMLGFDTKDIVSVLKENYPILKSVKIKRGLNGHVTLQVREEKHLYYTCHHVNYYLISGETLEVMAISSTPDLYAAYGAIYIQFPEEVSLQVGKKVDYAFLPYRPDDKPTEQFTYEVETGTPQEEYAYVMTLVKQLEENNAWYPLVGIDASDRYDLYFIYNANIKIRLGNMDNLERKLAQAQYLIAHEMSEAGYPTIVDVSDPAKSTLRENPDISLPWWCEN